MKFLAALLIATALAAPCLSASAADEKPASTTGAAVPAGHPAPAPAATIVKPDLAQGEAKFTESCAACHGADGNSATPANPKLAQQHPEYIFKQLKEFKGGQRQSAIMMGMVTQLSEQDMKNIAAWVTTKKAKPGFAKDKELVVLGERIYRGGIADRQVPACAGCHSPNGAGMPAQYPRLSGQHADYTTAQLTNFREGIRKNGPMMNQVAAKLNDREIRAVSDYIAGLR